MKLSKSLIFNMLLIIGEISGLIWAQVTQGVSIKYYTNLSNIIALISGILFVISYYVNNKILNNISSYFKFISTIGLTVTFLVVIFVLSPQMALTGGSYFTLVIPNGFIFLHIICPILEIVSFIFFENHTSFKKVRWYLLSCLYTFAYGIVILNLVYFTNVEPPYFFLNAKEIGYFQTFGIGLLLVLFTLLIAFILVTLNNLVIKHNSKEIK